MKLLSNTFVLFFVCTGLFGQTPLAPGVVNWSFNNYFAIGTSRIIGDFSRLPDGQHVTLIKDAFTSYFVSVEKYDASNESTPKTNIHTNMLIIN